MAFISDMLLPILLVFGASASAVLAAASAAATSDQRPIIQQIPSENGETWTFKGTHALAYSNLTHNYINTIPSEVGW